MAAPLGLGEGVHGYDDQNFSDQDRAALGYSQDGTLNPFGPGGYPNSYLPCDIDGSLFGEVLCYKCATEYLKADSQNAVFARCHING